MDDDDAPVAKKPADGASATEAGAVVAAANVEEKGFAAAVAAGLKEAVAVVAVNWKLPTAGTVGGAKEELNGFKALLVPLLPLGMKPCAAAGPLLLNAPCGCNEGKLDAALE